MMAMSFLSIISHFLPILWCSDAGWMLTQLPCNLMWPQFCGWCQNGRMCIPLALYCIDGWYICTWRFALNSTAAAPMHSRLGQRWMELFVWYSPCGLMREYKLSLWLMYVRLRHICFGWSMTYTPTQQQQDKGIHHVTHNCAFDIWRWPIAMGRYSIFIVPIYVRLVDCRFAMHGRIKSIYLVS